MAKTEQKYVVDRETLEHLIALLRDGLSKGASEEEIWEQTYEILDSEYREKTDQSFREMKEGKVKRSRNSDEMIRDLGSR